MNKKHKSGLPVDLWRDINRAAYAVSQASFAEHRAKFAAEALMLFKAGRTAAEIAEHLGAVAQQR